MLRISKKFPRGKHVIATVNQEFLNDDGLIVKILGRDFTWLDINTYNSLSEDSTYIEVIEKRQGWIEEKKDSS